MNRISILTTAFFASLFLISCTGETSSSQFVKINDLAPGEKPKIAFIKSEKENLEMRAKEIKNLLKKEINGNKKIIVIKTVYKEGFLFSGEIIFVPEDKNNKLEVKFISSQKRFLKTKAKEVEESLKKELSQIKKIIAVQSVYNSGHLVGAEIYY